MIDKKPEDEIVLVNFRVAKKDREQFDELFVKDSKNKRADILREMFLERIANADGEESRGRKIERLKQQLSEYYATQNKLIGLLKQDGHYDEICHLAESFGLTNNFHGNIQEVLDKFKNYTKQATDTFSVTAKEWFISLLEVVIHRRKVEAELTAFRERQFS